MKRAERWLPVVGYEDSYEVSDAGNVRSRARVVVCYDGRKIQYKSVLLRPGRTGRRVTVSLARRGQNRSHYVHNLVLTAFEGPCPLGLECCHNTVDSTDNRRENLRWGTRRENMLDRGRQGVDYHRNLTHCPYAHKLVSPNLRADGLKSGHRKCLACGRASSYVNYHKTKGRDFNFGAVADRYYTQIMRGIDAL